MTNKKLNTNLETTTALMHETGFTAAQVEAAMRRFINMLPTITQVMKNFALETRDINDK